MLYFSVPKDVDALRVPAASSTEKAGAGYVLCLEVQKYIAHMAMTPLNGGGWKKDAPMKYLGGKRNPVMRVSKGRWTKMRRKRFLLTWRCTLKYWTLRGFLVMGEQ